MGPRTGHRARPRTRTPRRAEFSGRQVHPTRCSPTRAPSSLTSMVGLTSTSAALTPAAACSRPRSMPSNGTSRPWIVEDACASHAGSESDNAGLLVARRFIGRSQIINSTGLPETPALRTPASLRPSRARLVRPHLIMVRHHGNVNSVLSSIPLHAFVRKVTMSFKTGYSVNFSRLKLLHNTGAASATSLEPSALNWSVKIFIQSLP